MNALLRTAAITVTALSALTASAQQFTLTDLGNPTPEASDLRAKINDRGTIVLTSVLTGGYDATDAGYTGQGGNQVHYYLNGAYHRVQPFSEFLPGMEGEEINNHDVIAGWAYDYEAIDHSTAWAYEIATGTMRQLRDESGGSIGGFAFDLNDHGLILGNETVQWNGNAWIYDGSEAVYLDDVLPEEKLYFALNNANQVLGTHFDDESGDFIYSLDTGAVQPLGEEEFWLLNDAGVAAGSRWQDHAIVVHSGGVTRTYATPGAATGVSAINNSNWIVGAWAPGPNADRRALFFNGETAVDLNTRVVNLGDWTLLAATDVNNHGQIVGRMRNPAGELHLFRLDPADGITSGNTWEHVAIEPQYGTFTITYDATPSTGGLDAVTGLSRTPADWFTDLAPIVRFAPSGRIDARNGGRYDALHQLNYQAGVTYHISVSVDLWSRRYSATVTPQGGSPTVIATDFAFRPEQARANELKALNLFATGGSLTVANVVLQPSGSGAVFSAGTWENAALPGHDEVFTVAYNVTPSRANLDAVTGVALGAVDWFDDLAAIVRFAPSGFIDARNGGSYQAVSPTAYAAGVTYRVRLTVNLGTRTYSATVSTAGGAAATIASGYAFRTEQAGVANLDIFALFSAGGGAAEVTNLTIE